MFHLRKRDKGGYSGASFGTGKEGQRRTKTDTLGPLLEQGEGAKVDILVPLLEQGERGKGGYSGASSKQVTPFGTAKRGKTHPFVPSKRPGDKKGTKLSCAKAGKGTKCPRVFLPI